MRKGWKKVKLGDLIHIKHGYAFKGKYFVKEVNNNLLLSPGNFAIGGGFKSDKFKYYEGPIPDDYVLSHNDIIVTMTDLSKKADTLGYPAKIPNQPEYTFLHNQRLGLISLLDDSINLDFLYWQMRTFVYQRFIAGSATGATVKHTAPKKIYAYKFWIPKTLNTQKKIATILSAYDDLIENNLKRIQLLEEMAQITYEEWFVRMRFPGHETAEWDEESGLPEGWEQKKLGEVCEFNMKKINKGYSGDIIYVDISSVSTNSIEKNNPIPFAKAPGRAKRKLSHGDLIWSCVRPNRKSYAMIWNPESNLIASTGFCVITPKFSHSSFIHNALSSVDFISYLVNNATGAAYPAVKVVDFENYEILIPTLELLNLFGNHFDKSLDTIHKLTLQNKSLKEARDLLLPRLMSGMIDVDSVKMPTVNYKMESDEMGSMAAEGDVGYGK